MLKAALAGAFVLAITTFVSAATGGSFISKAAAQDGDSVETTGAVAPTGPVVTEAKIARLKRALRLTPAQEAHWHPVESALRRMVQSARRESNGGVVQRVRARVADYANGAQHYQQVASAAGPLIATLDEKQKQDGLRLIREFGFSGQ